MDPGKIPRLDDPGRGCAAAVRHRSPAHQCDALLDRRDQRRELDLCFDRRGHVGRAEGRRVCRSADRRSAVSERSCGSPAPEAWIRRSYNLAQRNISDRGGHFPAMENGEMLDRRHARLLPDLSRERNARNAAENDNLNPRNDLKKGLRTTCDNADLVSAKTLTDQRDIRASRVMTSIGPGRDRFRLCDVGRPAGARPDGAAPRAADA